MEDSMIEKWDSWCLIPGIHTRGWGKSRIPPPPNFSSPPPNNQGKINKRVHTCCNSLLFITKSKELKITSNCMCVIVIAHACTGKID